MNNDRSVLVTISCAVLGGLCLSLYPVIQQYSSVRSFLLIVGVELILATLVLIMVYGRRWGLWRGAAANTGQESRSVGLIWRVEAVLAIAGCLAVSTYPLLATHQSLRSFFLCVGVLFLVLVATTLILFGKKWGLWVEEDSYDDKGERDVGWTRSVIMSFSFFGLVALYVFSACVQSPFSWTRFGHIAGVGSLYAGAFFAAGALMGFLFGIPRSLRAGARIDRNHDQLNTQGGNEDQRSNYTANTNLEEISDWLTKIIVGLGLINLKTIPGQLKTAAWYFANFCGKDYCESVAFAVMLYFSICGFFLG